MKNEICLGDRVKDRITGFTGIVGGISHWLTGCDHVGIIPECTDKDGKVMDITWFDVDRVTLIQAQAFELNVPLEEKKRVNPGGPSDNPIPSTQRNHGGVR